MKRNKGEWSVFDTLLIVFIAMFVLAVIGHVVLCVIDDRGPHPKQYPMTTVVVEISEPNDTVTCRDFNGNLWQFHGVEDWAVGDVASLLMDDAGTQLINDDKVLSAKYDGWFSGWTDRASALQP